MKALELRRKVIDSLRKQGFHMRGDKIVPFRELSKEKIRELHQTAVEHRWERSREGLYRKEHQLLSHIASGSEVAPQFISPRLIEVLPNSFEELLFRYANLHWSIPVSSGYGRRIRFIIIDEHNGKLMGLIGLGDPVFNLGPRDEWIGWTGQNKNERLRNVMDAFVLGAVPPYSFLLCGKLVAMLAASNEVREAFRRKYAGTASLIKGENHDARLALITTMSALGRSSIYNRIRLGDRRLYQSVGFTKGNGEFHFSNGLYGVISDFAKQHCEPTAKQQLWGSGFRNRREVIRKCLPLIGLSSQWRYHGIEREVFVIPQAENSREFLRGEHSRLRWFHQPASDIYSYFRDRWLLPRSQRDERYKGWTPEQWVLWAKDDKTHG